MILCSRYGIGVALLSFEDTAVPGVTDGLLNYIAVKYYPISWESDAYFTMLINGLLKNTH